jgi:hypothetical protein
MTSGKIYEKVVFDFINFLRSRDNSMENILDSIPTVQVTKVVATALFISLWQKVVR